MALRTALYAASLIPILALSACGYGGAPSEAAAPETTASDTAVQEQEPATAQTASGGDATPVDGETTRGPVVEAVARRFGLTQADTIILPTLYRAAAGLSAGDLRLDRSRGDPGYITVSGPVDADAVLRDPRKGLAFELAGDRVTEFLGRPVVITFVARKGEDWRDTGQGPALRAAWVEPNGASSGWRTMALAEDWRKAVFTYDAPSDASGTHILTVTPPDGQPVDIAAVALRVLDSSDPPDAGGRSEDGQSRPMQDAALPDDALPEGGGGPLDAG